MKKQVNSNQSVINSEFSPNTKLSLFQFSKKQNTIIKKKIEVEDYLKDKQCLILYPYPSTNPINSKSYDNFIKYIKIFSSLQENIDSSSEKPTNNSNDSNSSTQSKTKKTQQDIEQDLNEHEQMEEEIEKIKFLRRFDEVIGISDLDEKASIQYIRGNPHSNFTIISDPQALVQRSNSLPLRFEMITDSGAITQLKQDPSFFKIIVCSGLLLFGIVLFTGFAVISVKDFVDSFNNGRDERKRIKERISII
eukprot:CAMPEP_0170518502 /NCGR_PEP_ID=MMETSP0209-20121228/4178_1 /TAXON_ID=665100 ORGANISM="Litonotus pictus, Strain P1" /NCGR_SAMPLE_ID=MMETSP0209 /ASSEMBLY_ACC=CAM_ASM_000301 /LENGTH=249 /DNA_ID=CAMNT_0010804081 /DNA_START=177 /DNA_END=925 /DNA_ORIENTATION=-